MNNQLEKAKQIIAMADRITFFTGAGISQESGIPTFRDIDGIWSKYDPNMFATWRGILSTAVFQPAHLASFLHYFVEPIAQAQPNPAHFAIERLSRTKDVTIVTQNIDGLHQAAGSSKVIELHGNFFQSRSWWSGKLHSCTTQELDQLTSRLEE